MVSFKHFILEATLQKDNVNKDKERVEALINNLQHNLPFILADDGKQIKITPDVKWFKDLKSNKKLTTTYILDSKGRKIPLGIIQKTKEFGGLMKSTTSKEQAQLGSLISQISKLTKKDPISIKVGPKIYRNCIKANNTPGTPKSDFEIINTNGESVIFISHKDGNSPTGFKQWSGITDYINEYPEIQNFVTDVKTRLNDLQSFNDADEFLMVSGTYKRDIGDENLKAKACFGKDFGSNKFGINNVNCILQGSVKLKPQGTYYVLTADKMWLNGQIPGTVRNNPETGKETPDEPGYDPVLVVYKGGGAMRFDQQVRNARFSIYPSSGRGGDEI
jgi:hypothetical protein